MYLLQLHYVIQPWLCLFVHVCSSSKGLDLKPLSSTPAVDSTLTNNMSAKCNSTSVSCLKCGCLQGSKGTQNEAQKINPVKAR